MIVYCASSRCRNFMVNFILLRLTAQFSGELFSGKRAACGAFAGALSALIVFFPDPPFLGLAALRLDFAAAFAYHPLFWAVPIAFVLAFVCDEAASPKARRGINVVLAVLCALVVAVWVVRLVNPADAGLLFGGHAPVGVPADIIHLEQPRWLAFLRPWLPQRGMG